MSEHHWRPGAADVAQVDTITIANTWAQNDTIVFTIGQASFTLTIGTLVTTTQVATTIKEALNGLTTFTDTSASISPSGGTYTRGEFREISATSDSAVVTVTAGTAGKPFTLNVVETTAGSGTATEATATTATGKKFYDNANNWLEQAVPSDDDSVYFDQGSGDCLYGFDDIDQPDFIYKTADFTGALGLPEINEDSASYPYPEYRTKALTITSNAGSTIVRINEGAGSATSLVRIDGNDADVSFYVYGGQSDTNGEPQILLQGNNAATDLYVSGGVVGFGYHDETEHLDKLQVSQGTNRTEVIIGRAVDTANSDVDITGGEVTIQTATGSGTIVMHAGALRLKGDSLTHAAVTAWGGTVTMEAITITATTVGPLGVIDATGFMDAATLTDEVVIYGGGTIKDPQGRLVFSNGFQPTGCKITDVNLDFGTNRSYTVS